MRSPVFPKHANPEVDHPILRKSLSYVEDLVCRGEAFAIDPADLLKGVILRGSRHKESQDRTAMIGGGRFDSAWKIIPSDGMPVWQMPSVKTVLQNG